MRHPLLQKYDRLIEFFGQMLGQDYELSLFDLRAEGCPLIFIAGGLNSGRPLGHAACRGRTFHARAFPSGRP